MTGRADLVIQRAARALAAYEGRLEVDEEHIIRAAALALLHRTRDSLPPPPPEPDQQQPSDEQQEENDNPSGENQQNEQEPADRDEEFELPLPDPPPRPEDDGRGRDAQERIFEIGETFKPQPFSHKRDRRLRRGSGRRSATRTAQKQGRYVGSSMQGDMSDLALDATLRAAAPHQLRRAGRGRLAVYIEKQDIRCKVREKRVGDFLVFLVDASGSMGARARMAATKGAIFSLLLDAYQKRDRVALISFRKQEAQLNLPPTSSFELAARLLRELPIGGRTPLSAGLAKAHEQTRRHLHKEPSARPMVIILTDGRANAGLHEGLSPHEEALEFAGRMSREDRVRYLVVDTETQGVVRLGLAARLAAALGAEYFRIENLKAGDLTAIARRSC
jgi:magnesium chelatase subunit D